MEKGSKAKPGWARSDTSRPIVMCGERRSGQSPDSPGEIGGRRVFTEQPGRDLVHPLVGALGGQDRRDQDLERRFELEGRPAVGVLPPQDPDEASDTFLGSFHRLLRADVEQVLAEVEVLDVIIVRKAAEEVDL